MRGHLDDLRGDDIVQLPAESIRTAVFFQHRSRRAVRRVVARQASGACNFHRPRHVQLPAVRGLPLTNNFCSALRFAKFLHQIGFPIGRTIHRIGGVQRRFFVGVLRKLFL